MKRFSLLFLLGLACGCTLVRRFERNAPGDVDLRIPPPDLGRPIAEPPRDPGDHLVLLEVAPQAAAGIGFGGPSGGSRFSPALGVEAALLYGQDEASLAAAPFPFELPERAVGLAAGLVWFAESGQPARFSLALQLRRRPLSLGLGWAHEPSAGNSGAQATFSAGPLFVRGLLLAGRGGSIQLGIELPLALALLWSR